LSNWSLLLSFSLVILAMLVSKKEKLLLEKDLLVGSIRAVVQLVAVGYILKFIFARNNFWFTTALLLVMVLNAAYIAGKRGEGIKNSHLISFGAIVMGLIVTLGALIAFRAIAYKPSQAIPVSGMIVGNAMVAVGLVFRSLKQTFRDRREEVEVKLSLGAPPREAAFSLIRESIKTAMLPTVDQMKTLGIVQLPGMMTGLILAGANPLMAIKYQIMVAFMLAGAVTVAAYVASYFAYRGFFNEDFQIVS